MSRFSLTCPVTHRGFLLFLASTWMSNLRDIFPALSSSLRRGQRKVEVEAKARHRNRERKKGRDCDISLFDDLHVSHDGDDEEGSDSRHRFI